METFATAVILLSPAFCLACFAVFAPQRAVLISLLGLYLFMPQVKQEIFGIIEYDKGSTINLLVFVSAFLFYAKQILAFRPNWRDLPVIVYCFAQAAASLVNDLGPYDALSALKGASYTWLFPYLLGRVFFTSLAKIREVAVAIFWGGVIYILPCLFEIRMSPQLHTMAYGIHQHSFVQTIRFGGFRPTVFLQHGLMVGMWMTAASLAGVWLWASGTLKKSPVPYLSIGSLVGILFVTTILCKSSGAILLLVLGLSILFIGERFNLRIIFGFVIVFAFCYTILRVFSIWSGQELVEISNLISEDRSSSLGARLVQEDILVDKAMKQPWFGWGGWGRNGAYDEEKGIDLRHGGADGGWILVLGTSGIIGLGTWMAMLALPQLLFLRNFSARQWSDSAIAPAAIMAVILTLFLIDCLPNYMIMPIYPLCAGALTSIAIHPQTHVQLQIEPKPLQNRRKTLRQLWPPSY